MGYIAAIGSLVSAGVSLYGDLSKKSPGSALGAEAGTLKKAADYFINPFAYNQAYWNIDPQALEQQSINFGIRQAPAINRANMAQLQSLLNTALPGYQGMVNQMSQNAQSLLAGNVPADVQNQVQRFGAQSTLTSGIGGAGGAGAAGAGAALTNKAITARDLGLTSLNLQQQGASEASNLMQLSRNYLMPQPVNPTSLLPLSDLMSAQEWSKSSFFQANEAAYTAASNMASAQAGVPPTQSLTGAGGDIGAILQALLGKQGQSSDGSQQGIFGMLGGLFGGGGGTGGSGVTAASADQADPFASGGSLGF